MRYFLASLAALALTVPAQAATVLTDNFDGEGTTSVLNFTAFDNFTVTGNYVGPNNRPTVDLVKSGQFGITCVGGSGNCVDLDGSTGNSARILTLSSYAFNAGDIVTLTFNLSGSQRTTASDDFYAGFSFTTPTNLLNYTKSGAFGAGSMGNLFGIGDSAVYGTIAGNTPFTTTTLKFTAGNAGSLYAFVGALSYDNVGPLVDDFTLDITAGVPEPSTWAMMIMGFGLVGSAMRRRTRTLAAA